MGCVIKYKGKSIPEEQFLQYLNKQIAINQLFENDSNLANQVYEALGFEIPTTRLQGKQFEYGEPRFFDVVEELTSGERANLPSSILINKLLKGKYLPEIKESQIILGLSEAGIWRPNIKKIEASGENKSTLSKKIGHELLHSVTNNIILSYQNLKGVLDFNDKYYKDFIKQGYVKPVDLSKSQIEALDNLVRIRNKVISYVEQNKNKIQKQDRGFGTYDYFIRTNYTESETDLHEFISEVFTNPELINILKEIPTEGKKSNLFKDFINVIAKILGFTNTSILEDIIAYSEEAFFQQPQITPQQKQQAISKYSQYLESLNKPNTNPILQNNLQEQQKKFTELQERLNNKEFLEGAKNAFESSEELQNVYYEALGVGQNIKTKKTGLLDYFLNVKKDSVFQELIQIGENLGIGIEEYESDSPLQANWNGKNVTINKTYGKVTSNVIAHEVVHGILHTLTNNDYTNSKLNLKLEKFKTELFDYIEKKGINNLNLPSELRILKLDYIKKMSNQEIVTYAFTDSQFSDFLASIKTDAKVNSNESFWNKLINIFNTALKELGFTSKLDELIDILNTEVPLFNNVQIIPQQKQDALNAYTDYIARVSLGIIKNPSSGGYNYTSKVKDIVYRGGNLGTKQPQDVEAFTTNKSYAKYRAEQNNTKVYPAVLNIKDSKIVDKKETRTLSLDRDEFQYEDYGFTDNKDQTNQLGNFYTIKENNRHILGSKQDIEGFKEFVQEEKDDLNPFIDESNKIGDESINERLKKYEESIKIPNNVKSKVLEKIEKETEKVKEKLLSLGLKQEGNKFELITNSYATFRMKLKELENVNAIISTNKTSDFYQIIARLKNVDSTMELKKQGELPFTPIEVKQIIQEQQFLNDVADNVFEELSEEEKQILKKKIENGDYNLNCKI